jgi:hypothetical protein
MAGHADSLHPEGQGSAILGRRTGGAALSGDDEQADSEKDVNLTPIYNRSGRACGWADADTIRDMRGRVAAFIFGISVVSLHGKHLGWLQDGNFRDSYGAIVGWVAGASGGPAKPAAGAVPAMPAMAARPAMPAQPATPAIPAASPSWSAMTWERFIDQ